MLPLDRFQKKELAELLDIILETNQFKFNATKINEKTIELAEEMLSD